MVRNALFLSGILFVTLAYFFWLRDEGAFPALSTATGHVAQVRSSIPPARASRTLEVPRTEVKFAATELSPGCQKFWSGLRAIDLGDVAVYPPKLKEFPDFSECKTPPLEFQVMHKQLEQLCGRLDFSGRESMERTGWEAKMQPCYDNLLMYRSLMTEWETRNIPASEISDPKVLEDKLFVRFTLDAASSVDVARRLVELQPENYLVRKALVWGELNRAAKLGKGNPQSPEWRVVDDALEAAKNRKEFARDDRQLAEIESAILAKKHADPKDLIPNAEKMNRDHPDWGVGPYQLAFVASKQGDSQAAVRWAKEAARREPGNPVYKSTLGKLLAGFSAAKQGVFETNTIFWLGAAQPAE